jgi:hypothetical protein
MDAAETTLAYSLPLPAVGAFVLPLAQLARGQPSRGASRSAVARSARRPHG